MMNSIQTIRLTAYKSVFSSRRLCSRGQFGPIVANCLSTASSGPEQVEACLHTSEILPHMSNTWTTTHQLATFLSKRIVASNEHFVVIDKPAGLSVWGHSLTKQEALSVLHKHSSALSIKDCLPSLAKLLDPRWTDYKIEPAQTVFNHKSKRTRTCTEVETEPSAIPSLFIVEALPADYSGLILLARTSEYATAAEKFYHAAHRQKVRLLDSRYHTSC
ncbi:unnamed protein product [Echinostoma caproni]|uniref:PseudoU_synth_2 domain-containing protein n=1 Tax=Echinostoma caproni TaxID=27848 RepID=A0A183AUY3_9TREM|nr:unnamed protein product [Echinostoma caproni]